MLIIIVSSYAYLCVLPLPSYQCYHYHIFIIIGLPLLSKCYVIDSLMSYLSYQFSQAIYIFLPMVKL